MLGWSWLFPPYRWHFDARALSAVRATAFDGACLREKCDADPALRLRPDGPLRAGADRAPAVDAAPAPRRLWRRSLTRAPRPAPMVPVPFRVADREQDTADTWTLSARAARRAASPIAPGQFVMVYGVRDRRGADLGQRPARAGRARSSSRCAPSAPSRTRSARPSRARARPARAVRQRWPVEAAAGGDVVVVAGGIGLAPLRPVVVCTRSSGAPSYGAVTVLYGARTPGDLLYTRRARASGATRSRSRSRSTPRARLDGPGRRRAEAGRQAEFRPTGERPRSSAGPRS